MVWPLTTGPLACPLTTTSLQATMTICDLDLDILALICDEIEDDYIYGRRFWRPSVKALSETCKQLRVAAARVLFHTVAIWDWDTFHETLQEMMQCELVLLYTRHVCCGNRYVTETDSVAQDLSRDSSDYSSDA